MRAITRILTGAVLCAAISPMSAMADGQKPATIKQREHNQQARINQGVRSGELTRRETEKLEAKEAKIRVDQRFAKKDGTVTPAERKHLQKELNNASADIYKQKHDGQTQK